MYIILEYTSNVQLMKTTCCLQARAVTDMLVRRCWYDVCHLKKDTELINIQRNVFLSVVSMRLNAQSITIVSLP